MFIIVNIRKYRSVLLLLVTILITTWMILFPQTMLRFFYPLKYKDIVFEQSQKYNIDPYMVYAIIKVESDFKVDAKSHKDAKGLMQLTDKTALWGAEELDLEDFNISEVYEPDTNIQLGCWYLSVLNKEFNNDIDLVLAAYNGGSGNVNKWLQDDRYSKTGESLDIIPFNETNMYVKRVKKEYNIYRKLYTKK